MSSIIPFTFPSTGHQIRVIGDAESPLFHHGDICAALQHTNPTVAARMLDDEDSVMVDLREITAGQTALNPSFPTPATGNSQARFVTESGMYTLALASKAPGAKQFRRWLTHEVIPSIRRTGSYSLAPAGPTLPDLTTPSGVLALAEQFVETARQLVEADERIREMEPKALAHDTFLSAQDGDVLVRQAAKLMGWQEQLLRQFLIEEHLIYRRQATCGQTQWDFYAAHREHFRAVEKTVEHTWGRCAHYTLFVRPAGLVLIQKRITKRQAAMTAAIEGGVR